MAAPAQDLVAAGTYVMLFGTLVYLYGSLLPRLDRLEAKVEARNSLDKLNDDEAVELLQAKHASTNVPQARFMQNSDVHARIDTRLKLNHLEAQVTKLLAGDAVCSKRKP
ncbi:unnamed protein product [Urochloa humidicola]